MSPAAGTVSVLDGQATIGGTKILLEQGGTRLLLDFGTNYQRMGRYYEEFLQPRPSRGLVDFLELGLLPKLAGAYRPELFPPADYPRGDEGWPGGAPDAVLLTHGHLDHAGGLAFLDPSIPVLCTPTTLALLRAWQEAGRPGLTSEVTYYAPHTGSGREGSVGESTRGRLLVADRSAARAGRRFQLFGEVPTRLAGHLAASPYGPRTAYEPTAPEAAPSSVGEFRLRSHAVDHSVYGAVGFLIEGDGAAVAYSGDLRFHGERGAETEGFLRLLEARRPEVLLVEGTRIQPEDAPPAPVRASEADVERNCLNDVRAYEGRLVVADFGPRNVERLRTFRRIALASGRQLVVTPKDAFLLRLLHAADPNVELDVGPGGTRILEEPTTGRESPWLAAVREEFPVAHLAPSDITARPGRWILCFSFFDCNDLVDLRGATRGGLWLYSSSEAHGEEQEFDFVRLTNWIEWAGMRAVGFRLLSDARGTPRPFFEHPEDVGHHASGHATQEELVEFVARVGARRILPVHTSQPVARYERLLRGAGVAGEVLSAAPGVPIPIA